jgi:dTDP-4-dehydrorhamnose reductase
MGNKFLNEVVAQGDHAYMSTVDALDYQALKTEMSAQHPDAVINCAGITGVPNVDWCEDHKEETLRGNVALPLNILRVCTELGIYWANVGSGCIYDGDNNGRGYAEEDTPNYEGSFYSYTKRLAEDVLKKFPVLILRLRIPLDSVPSPKNVIDKLVRYTTIIDVPNSISVVPEFVQTSIKMMRDRRTGIYNMTNPGALRYPELLELYKKIVDPSFSYTALSLEELKTKTKASRSNCVLDTTKRESQGYHMTDIHEVLEPLLKEYKTHL